MWFGARNGGRLLALCKSMRRVILALTLLAASGCGGPVTFQQSSSTASAPRIESPSPQPTAPPSNVLAIVSGPASTPGGGASFVTSISLVNSNGSTIATAHVPEPPFRPNAAMSWTSASRTRVYYLSGGFVVNYLGPDGSTGGAHSLPVLPNEEAGFSVSPDDKRIAVSIFSYTLPPSDAVSGTQPTYNGMRLYVEDLQGGGHHVDIFSSATVAEFPIGWVAGHIVLAVTKPVCCQSLQINPYGATSIHIVNPDNGDRLLALCTGSHVPEGPIEPFGVMCTELGASFWAWDGTQLPTPAAIPLPGDRLNAASPDGTRVAIGQDEISIWGPRGSSYSLHVSGHVYGWLDENHIVIRKLDSTMLSVFDLQSQAVTDLPGATSYLGTFPAALS